jgi:hypothetical protein
VKIYISGELKNETDWMGGTWGRCFLYQTRIDMNNKFLNSVSHWYGRLGNNIQQICNGILYSQIKGDGFISPFHELIEQIKLDNENNSTVVKHNRFFHYNTANKDFDIDIDYLYSNIGKIAKEYVTPNFKFKIGQCFDDDTLVIHIRSGDIFSCEHNAPHAYTPNPLQYYLNLIDKYDNIIVVTEPDDYNPIINELKKIKKVTIQSKSVAEDFSTLLRSKNIATSGTGTFAVASALCSTNIKNFYCSNLYLNEHLNPEMVISSGIKVYMTELENYFKHKTWKNNEEQRKFILEYNSVN